MINTGTILDSALSRQHDDSAELRQRALHWLNTAIGILNIEARWFFLKSTVTRDVTDNEIDLPGDFDTALFVQGENWYLKSNHHLTEEDARNLSDHYDNPYGFSISSDKLTFHPKCPDAQVELTYLRTIPTYNDNAVTIIPDEFAPLLVRSVVNAIYEYEADQRGMITITLEATLLNQLKVKDSRRWPVPKSGKYL